MKIAVVIPQISEAATEDYSTLHINEISSIDDASCDDLFLGDCLDYISTEKQDLIDMACSKIKYGGRLVVIGSDLQEICKAKSSGAINEERANSMLYSGRTGLFSAMTLVDAITQKGLRSSSRAVNGFKYTLTFERPKPDENIM